MFKLFQKTILVTIAMLFFSFTAEAEKFGKVDDAEWLISAPEDYPEADAIILFDMQSVKIEFKKVKIERHVRIKVLKSSGIDKVGEQSITYYKKINKIKHFKAHTITPDGKKHKVDKDMIFDKVHNNWITTSFSFPNVSEGAILEYSYTLNQRDWYFNIPYWFFQNEIYTLKSKITVSLTPGYAFDMLYRNVPSKDQKPVVESRIDPRPGMRQLQKLKNYIWEMENLPPIIDEPYMSSINDYRASLRFLLISYTFPDASVYHFVKDWKDQAEGLESWFYSFCNKENDIKKLAEEVTAGINNPEEKSKAIFEYIKKNYKSSTDYETRYFKNDKMSKLLEDKTGTPEEKNLLLVRMHKAIGIEAWPVLISTRANGEFEPSYPDDRQFDYLISFVQLGNSWEFLDVADRNSIYGILQPQCLTNGGFLLDGDNSQLVRITIKPILSSRNDLTVMHINTEGHAACSTSSIMTGYYAAEKLNDFDKTTEEKFIEKFIKNRIDKAITMGEYTCIPEGTNNFTVTGSFETDELVRQLDENLVVKPVSFAFERNPFISENRFFPVDFTFPFTYQNTVKINLEKTPKEIHLPNNIVNDLGKIRLSRTSTLDGSTIIVTSTLEVLEPVQRLNSYKKVKELFEQLSLFDDEEISFVYETTE